VRETIYVQHITPSGDRTGERGYRLMAEEMVRSLRETWQLKPRR
jgi:hypothetical protein